MQQAKFCPHHTSKEKRDHGAEGAPHAALEVRELEGLCSDLTTATNINRAIAQTYLLLARGRISQKQAVAFGYLSQLLLQTVPGIRAEYVSAFGYPSWEARLRASLTLDSDETPGPSGGENGHDSHEDADSCGSSENGLVGIPDATPLAGCHPEKIRPGLSARTNGGGAAGFAQRRPQELSSRPSGTAMRAPTRIAVRGRDLLFASHSSPAGDSNRATSNCKSPAASPSSSPQKEPENITSQRPLRERVISPDFGDLLTRSLALFDRKYDMTPEGRREAKALALELELMNPAPAKPRRDYFGRVVELLRRLRDHQQGKPPRAIDPLYLEAIRAAPHPPSWAKSAAGPAGSGVRTPDQSRVRPPLAPPALRREGPALSPAGSLEGSPPNPPVSASPQEPVRPAPSPVAPAISPEPPLAPPRIPKPANPHLHSSGSNVAPGFSPASSAGTPDLPPSAVQGVPACDPVDAPEPGAASASRSSSGRGTPKARPSRPASLTQEEPSPWPYSPDLQSDPDFSPRVGHAADWYAPASWSRPRPDPFPSRKEKMKRQLRSMSNSRWRRLQHRNQVCSFWC